VCRNWETEHYNSVLEITFSFLGIHKWEPDIYFGFSPVIHLQCGPATYRKTEKDKQPADGRGGGKGVSEEPIQTTAKSLVFYN
jgi:hypothetical protein